MTDLTEQWKKGELPEGYYYVKDGENMIAEYLDGYFYNDGNPITSFSGGVDSVLAPVPSYDEWFKIKNLASLSECLQEKNIECLHRENELKEILERHKKATAKAQIRSCDLEIINAQLKETVEALESELKEVCDVLIRKCPEMKEWVMLNWKHLYEVENENI